MLLYNADRSLISQAGVFQLVHCSFFLLSQHKYELLPVLTNNPQITTELKMKAVVESGTMDVDFSLDNGGSIILRLQFLLSDEDRRRVQEMVMWFFLGYFHVSSNHKSFLIHYYNSILI